MADYIYLDAALAICEKEYRERLRMLDYCGDTVALNIGYAIKALPAADVAPVVHGRWEQCFEDWRKQIEGDKCSICGFEHYGASIAHYHFCPNCGAKMGGDGNADY